VTATRLRALEETHHVNNSPRQVMLHSDGALEGDVDLVLRRAAINSRAGDGSGDASLRCGVVESVALCEAFVGVRVRVRWGGVTREEEGDGVGCEGGVGLEGVLGVRRKVEDTIVGNRAQRKERLLSACCGWKVKVMWRGTSGSSSATSGETGRTRQGWSASSPGGPQHIWCPFDVSGCADGY
jgi:hypothetical protein